MQVFLFWLLGFGVAVFAILSWARLRQAGAALVLATADSWLVCCVGLAPALDADSSSRGLMQRVGQHIGPAA